MFNIQSGSDSLQNQSSSLRRTRSKENATSQNITFVVYYLLNTGKETYRIAGNFRLEKILAYLPRCVVGEKYFENFVTLKFLTRTGFTRSCQAVVY